MKTYLSYFKLKFIMGLQYRSAALAGMCTQVFFGLVYILIYSAFYESGNTDNLPMPLNQLISYLWLCQSFFVLIYSLYKDKEIIKLIKSGNIAYELCRPQDLYLMWCSKILGDRLSNLSLRMLPVIIIAVLLPKPYNLDLSISLFNLLLFVISIFLVAILVTVLTVLYHVICLFTLDEKGIVNIFMVISDLLSGMVIPIPFFPKYLQNINNLLPFRYIGDFSFRFYVGNIGINDFYIGIIIQLVWIIILVILGRLLMNKALKKAVIQGG